MSWEGLSVTYEEALEVLERDKAKRKMRDRRVCSCGHVASAHQTRLGLTRCEPSRMACPCRKLEPVLEASHVIGFLAKTTGTGTEHALTRGLVASAQFAAKRGTEFEVRWLVPLTCAMCQAKDRPQLVPGVEPVAVGKGGTLSDSPEALNVLLCRTCVAEARHG